MPALDPVLNVLPTFLLGSSASLIGGDTRILFATANATADMVSDATRFAQLLAQVEANGSLNTPDDTDACETAPRHDAAQTSPGFAAVVAAPNPLGLLLLPVLSDRTAERTQGTDLRPLQGALYRTAAQLRDLISNAVPAARVEILRTSAQSSAVHIFHIAISEGEVATSRADNTSAVLVGMPGATVRPSSVSEEHSENLTLHLSMHRNVAPEATGITSSSGEMDRQPHWQPADNERSNAVLHDTAQRLLSPLPDDSSLHGQLSTSTTASPVTTFDGLRSVLRATVTTLMQQGTTLARIVLYPESLGTIVVQLQPQATGTMVEIVVSSPTTLRVVEQTVEALRRDLAGGGIVADTITVRMRDERLASQQTVAPVQPLVAAIGDEHAERRRERHSFHRRQRQSRTRAIFDHFM